MGNWPTKVKPTATTHTCDSRAELSEKFNLSIQCYSRAALSGAFRAAHLKKNDMKTKRQIMKEHIYTLHLTKRQVELLSYACDRFSRLICGQDWTYQELFEEAWEKRCKEATGNFMDEEWQGGWSNMRDDAKVISEEIKRRYWGLERNTMYGIHYDDTADILFSLHQVLRHQLWLDRPDDKKSTITVDATPAMRWGSEPLAKIENFQKGNITTTLLQKGKEDIFRQEVDSIAKKLGIKDYTLEIL